ncbi:MAG: hypothetical protein AB7Y46_08715 [Armatimonadota bacterium]
MPVQDYTTYTEYNEVHDPLAVTATLITASDLDREHDHYVYRDFGVGALGNLTYELETQVTAGNHSLAFGGIWGIANLVDDWSGWVGSPALFWYWNPYGNGPQVRLQASSQDDSVGLAVSTMYYVRIVRAGTTCTAYVYSDAARTTLVDSMSVACSGDAYRYLYAAFNVEANQPVRQISYTVGHLTLEEATPLPVIMGHYRRLRCLI